MKIDKNSIVDIIIKEVLTTIGADSDNIDINVDSVIYGDNSPLVSLALVSLIVAVEQCMEDEFGSTITLADERAMSMVNSPFRSVGSLADYIEELLDENLND